MSLEPYPARKGSISDLSQIQAANRSGVVVEEDQSGGRRHPGGDEGCLQAHRHQWNYSSLVVVADVFINFSKK